MSVSTPPGLTHSAAHIIPEAVTSPGLFTVTFRDKADPDSAPKQPIEQQTIGGARFALGTDAAETIFVERMTAATPHGDEPTLYRLYAGGGNDTIIVKSGSYSPKTYLTIEGGTGDNDEVFFEGASLSEFEIGKVGRDGALILLHRETGAQFRILMTVERVRFQDQWFNPAEVRASAPDITHLIAAANGNPNVEPVVEEPKRVIGLPAHEGVTTVGASWEYISSGYDQEKKEWYERDPLILTTTNVRQVERAEAERFAKLFLEAIKAWDESVLPQAISKYGQSEEDLRALSERYRDFTVEDIVDVLEGIDVITVTPEEGVDVPFGAFYSSKRNKVVFIEGQEADPLLAHEYFHVVQRKLNTKLDESEKRVYEFSDDWDEGSLFCDLGNEEQSSAIQHYVQYGDFGFLERRRERQADPGEDQESATPRPVEQGLNERDFDDSIPFGQQP